MDLMSRAGGVLGGIPILFFLVDGVTHVLKIKPVVDAFQKLSIPIGTSVPLGILQVCLVLIFLFPTTRILGAVLITAYLGGAVAIHVRAASTTFEMLFPVILGLMMWGGLYLFDNRIQIMITRSN